MVGQGPAVRPVHEFGFAGGGGAQLSRCRSDSDAEQVEPVGVPAGLHRGVGLGAAAGVQSTGLGQEGELSPVDVEEPTLVGRGQLGAPATVPRISVIVDAAGVVEEREEQHNLSVGTGLIGEPEAVFQDPSPVSDAVDS